MTLYTTDYKPNNYNKCTRCNHICMDHRFKQKDRVRRYTKCHSYIYTYNKLLTDITTKTQCKCNKYRT